MFAAVVVTYSAPIELLERCLAALRADGAVDRVILVDTGNRPQVSDRADEVVRIDNHGYGAAANAGFDRAIAAGADFVALLNDDVVVRSGWATPLLAAFDDASVGAVQPKLLHAGSGLVNSLGVEIGPDGAGTDIGDGTADDGGLETTEIGIFTGGAVVLSRPFIEATNGFDERYFLYYEDVDLALRGAALGWRYRLAPASVVDHARGTSTSQQSERTRMLQERNRLWCTFRFGLPSMMVSAVWLSIRRLRHSPRSVHRNALLAGLSGVPTRWWERARRRERAQRP